MFERKKYDQVWIENRFRYRKGMKGSALRLHEETGYLESTNQRGFSAEMKDTFIKRFMLCNNMKQICESVNIDIQAVYDAIALDKKFRDDINYCNEQKGRKKQLNDELLEQAVSEKTAIISELTNKMDKYLK